jgi:hypothetical protein
MIDTRKYAGELRVGDIWTERRQDRAARSYRVIAIAPGLAPITIRVTGECVTTGQRRTMHFFLVNRVEVREEPTMISVTTLPDQARDAIDGQPLNDASAREPVSGSPFKLADIWTAIAMRPRNCLARQKLYWQPISGAPMSVQEAWCLADAGTLLVASRHQPDRVELVVRSRTPERSFSSAT